jgi:hypothetical protein
MTEVDFMTANGAGFEGRDADGNLQFKISIPLDEHGYLGRQCPSCSQVFRIHAANYEALPDDIQLQCVYRGHQAHHSEYMTERQMHCAARRVSCAQGTHGIKINKQARVRPVPIHAQVGDLPAFGDQIIKWAYGLRSSDRDRRRSPSSTPLATPSP